MARFLKLQPSQMIALQVLAHVLVESGARESFFLGVFDENAHSQLEVLSGSLLIGLVLGQREKLGLRKLPDSVETHVVKRVELVAAPVDLEAVHDEVFGP